MSAYRAFLERKALIDPPTGFDPATPLPEAMFAFQADIARWALRRGRAALFAGTGLGKSLMELAWGSAVGGETRRPILHFAPLAVSAQLVREAEKFDIPARLVRSPLDMAPGVTSIVRRAVNVSLDAGVARSGARTHASGSLGRCTKAGLRDSVMAPARRVRPRMP